MARAEAARGGAAESAAQARRRKRLLSLCEADCGQDAHSRDRPETMLTPRAGGGFAPGAGVGALAESTWVDTPRVAAGADDGSIRLVYVDAPAVGGHADYCNALCWTDASTLVSGGRDGGVQIIFLE